MDRIISCDKIDSGRTKMKKAMTILYSVKNALYINLTNKCPCNCTFCIRTSKENEFPHIETLWLLHEPSFEEIRSEFLQTDVSNYKEIVFCGYGEPTEALDVLLQTARFIKENYSIPVRINTNGLGNLINKKDITPLFKGLIDSVSISLNSSNPQIYQNTVRPIFKEQAFPALLEFARNAKKYVPKVTFTTVKTTISQEDEEKCLELAKSLGVNYRIREYEELK